MPSPAERRRGLETALRGVAYAGLALLLWETTRPAARDIVDTGNVRAELPRWTADPAVRAVHVALGATASAAELAWLRALIGAGVGVSWSGEVPAGAAALEATADPAGGAVLRVAAPSGSVVRVADALGPVDSAPAGGGGATFGLASGAAITVGVTTGRFAVPPAESLATRRAVVLGSAGWESKFVLAALEGRGWKVDARLVVAPGLAMRQGAPVPFDTARQAVVVALDSAAVPYAVALARFVRSGGGLVLGPGAARALPGLAVGAIGAALPAARLTPDGPTPRLALTLHPASLRPLGVPLEMRDAAVAVAARRLGAGRVVQVGYEDTWRWRMTGGPDAVEAHRAWWAGVVAAAAYRPAAGAPGLSGAAPRAELVAALGPASPAPAGRTPGRWWPWALVLLLGALGGEWTSRRLRGAA